MAGGNLGDGHRSGGLVGSLLEVEGGGTLDLNGVGGSMGVGGVDTSETGRETNGDYWTQ